MLSTRPQRCAAASSSGGAGSLNVTAPQLEEDSSPQCTNSTVSTITTNQNDHASMPVAEETVEEVNTGNSSDNSVWQFTEALEKYYDKGKAYWKCLFCKKPYSQHNASKALKHITKTGGPSIQACRAPIARDLLEKYRHYSQENTLAKVSKRKQSDLYRNNVEDSQQSLVVAYEQMSNKKQAISSDTSVAHITGTGTVTQSWEKNLDIAISSFIYAKGLPFSICDNVHFDRVLRTAKQVPQTYKPPSRNKISGDLLKLNFESVQKSCCDELLKDADIFGLSLYGDGATVKRTPFINVMASGVNQHAGVLEIHDCTRHVQQGGLKDAKYIMNLFEPYIRQFDSVHSTPVVDTLFFDGASNVQKAGRMLTIKFPTISVLHGAEHVVSLFFSDLATKISPIKTMITQYRKVYGLVGLGSHHSPYAMFMHHSKESNKGRPIGLIRAADTRMAGYFLAFHRMFRLQAALRAFTSTPAYMSWTIQGAKKKKFLWLKKLVEDNMMWEAIHILLCCCSCDTSVTTC